MVFSYNCLYPASHAHTLLLDLEQLVVMENLDKIKLDCSSSSSSTCNASSSSTTNTNHNNTTKLRSLIGTVKSSAASIIDSTLPKMQKTGKNFDGFINHTTASFGRSTSNALNGLLFNHANSTHNNNVLLVAENAYQMDQPFDPYFDISKFRYCTFVCGACASCGCHLNLIAFVLFNFIFDFIIIFLVFIT